MTRGRPTIAASRKRRPRGIGFSDEEHAANKERARELGVPLAVFVRWMCRLEIEPRWASVLAGKRR